MVTIYFPWSARPGIEATRPADVAEADDANLLQRAVIGVQRLICGFHGHDAMLHFEDKRMCLRCTTCGHETPGWAIDQPRPELRFLGEPRRHVLARVGGLVESRRVA